MLSPQGDICEGFQQWMQICVGESNLAPRSAEVFSSLDQYSSSVLGQNRSSQPEVFLEAPPSFIQLTRDLPQAPAINEFLFATPPSSPNCRSRLPYASSVKVFKRGSPMRSNHTEGESLAMARPRPPSSPIAWLRESTPPRRRPAEPILLPPRRAGEVVVPLHRALKNHDLLAVQAALKKDPTAAKEFLMEDRCQPMVCYAAEQQCCREILLELGAHGADFNAVNADGFAPLRIIAEWMIEARRGVVWLYGDDMPTVADDANADVRLCVEARAVRAAKAALACGARPQACGPDGLSAIDVASARCANHLEELLRAVDAAQVYAMFCRASRSAPGPELGPSSLPCTALRVIGKHLIPQAYAHAVIKSVEGFEPASS